MNEMQPEGAPAPEIREVHVAGEVETSGRAIASLVFAILGIVGVAPCLGPILGLVLGHGERSGIGRAGVVLSWVTLALQVLVVVVILAVLGIGLLTEIFG